LSICPKNDGFAQFMGLQPLARTPMASVKQKYTPKYREGTTQLRQNTAVIDSTQSYKLHNQWQSKYTGPKIYHSLYSPSPHTPIYSPGTSVNILTVIPQVLHETHDKLPLLPALWLRHLGFC